MIWQQIREVPWGAVLFQIETAVAVLIAWQMSKHHYHVAWIRFAPAKARQVVREAIRQKEAEHQENLRLRQENAQLRGQIAAAQMMLREPQAAPLTYYPKVAGGS